MESVQSGLELLYKVKDSGGEIRLLNVFKGVPISYPAKVIGLRDGALQIRTERLQIVCLYRERVTYIQGDAFPETIRAWVSAIDLGRLEAELDKFELVTGRIGKRTQVRVQPGDPIQSDLQIKGVHLPFRGELSDISQNGLSVMLKRDRNIAAYFTMGTGITVAFHLPGVYEIGSGNKEELSAPSSPVVDRYSREGVRGSVYSASRQERDQLYNSRQRVRSPLLKLDGLISNLVELKESDRFRMGVRSLPDDPSRKVITEFISSRQSEIIREIRAISDLVASQKTLPPR